MISKHLSQIMRAYYKSDPKLMKEIESNYSDLIVSYHDNKKNINNVSMLHYNAWFADKMFLLYIIAFYWYYYPITINMILNLKNND